MAASGDWVTPRLNGIKYFEKPPLQYWATAVALEVFGDHDFPRASTSRSAACHDPAGGLHRARGSARPRRASPRCSRSSRAPTSWRWAASSRSTWAHVLDHGDLCACARRAARGRAARSAAGCSPRGRRWRSPCSRRAWSGIVFPARRSLLHCVLRRDFTPSRGSNGRAASRLPRDRRALVRRGVLRNPEFARFLLRPRALRALPHRPPPARGALVVLPADPRRGLPAVDVRAARGDRARVAREAATRGAPAAAPGALCALHGRLLQRLGLEAPGLRAARLSAAGAGARALPRRRRRARSSRWRCCSTVPLAPSALGLVAWRSPRRRTRAVDAGPVRRGAASARGRGDPARRRAVAARCSAGAAGAGWRSLVVALGTCS